jgi:HSP20 family molecular chaperone IbpA
MTTEIESQESAIDPWTDLDRAVADLRQRFFDSWSGEPARPAEPPAPTKYLRPARTDVTDTGASYRIVAEIPGIPKDQLDVRVRGSSVEIRGETASPTPKDGESLVWRERFAAGYFRTLELPEPVIATDAKAKVENGVLELDLPKQHPTPAPAEVKVPVQ